MAPSSPIISLTQRGQDSVTLQPDWLPFNSLAAGVINKQKYKTGKVSDLPHIILLITCSNIQAHTFTLPNFFLYSHIKIQH